MREHRPAARGALVPGRDRLVGRARTLPEVYRHFGAVDAVGSSPLYERVALSLSESEEALRAIGTAPVGRRHPALILAALHDLALAPDGPPRSPRRTPPGTA